MSLVMVSEFHTDCVKPLPLFLVLLGGPQIPNVFTNLIVWRDLETFVLSFQSVKTTASRVLKESLFRG
jgi:hypothetical protein